MLTEEQKKQIIENNKEISRLLEENEKIYSDAKSEDPNGKFSIPREDRIHVPKGQVPIINKFIDKLDLSELIFDEDLRRNIAYNYQLVSFFTYIMNRFYIHHSLEAMFCKNAIINLESIIETLVTHSLEQVKNHCKTCPQIAKCPYYVSNRHSTFASKVQKIEEQNLLHLTNEQYELLKKAVELRNHVHISGEGKNEYREQIFTIGRYNEIHHLFVKIYNRLHHIFKPAYQTCLKEVLRSKE